MVVLDPVTLTGKAGVVDWSIYPHTGEVKLSNHSAFVLTIRIGGLAYVLDPFTADRYPVPSTAPDSLTYEPAPTVGPAGTGTLLVQLANLRGETIPGIYPHFLR